MKYVDLQHGAEGQELSHTALSLIQDGSKESIQAIVQALGVLSNEVTILWGLNVVTDGTDYAIGDGAVFYNNEVHLVDAYVGNSVANVPVLKTNFIDLEGPVRFTTQNEYSVYFDNKMVIELAPTGSGVIDLDQTVRLKDKVAELIDYASAIDELKNELLGGAGAAFDTLGKIEGLLTTKANKIQGAWTDIALNPEYTIRNGQTPQYRVDQFGVVHLRGEVKLIAAGTWIAGPGAVPAPPTGTGGLIGLAITTLDQAGSTVSLTRCSVHADGSLALPAGYPAANVNGSFYLYGVSYATDDF
jgi:predicted secreted protein